MTTAKYIKGKDGKFKGSIGQGKTKVPTASKQTTEAWNIDSFGPVENMSPIEKANAEYGYKLAVLTSQSTDEDMLWNSWQSRHGQVRKAVGENVNTPPELQLQMVKDNSDRSRFPEGDENYGAFYHLANNPNATPEALDAMARMDFPDVKEIQRNVARNPNTSRATLEFLLNKQDPMFGYDVAYAVNDNPNTTNDLLEVMAINHPDSLTRKYARQELERRPIWNTKEATWWVPSRADTHSPIFRALADLESLPELAQVKVQVPATPDAAREIAAQGCRRDALVALAHTGMGREPWSHASREVYASSLRNPNLPQEVKDSVEKFWLDRWGK